MIDTFRGDNAHLVSCIEALLEMDADGILRPHGVGGHARDLLSAAAVRLAPTQGADGESLRPVAIYQVRASRYVSEWTDVSPTDALFHSSPDYERRIVYATRDTTPSESPNQWADLWYFVMDEVPMEFERIVTSVSPSQWHSEAHKLMRAKYPIAPRERT